MPSRNKKSTRIKKKDLPQPIVTPKPDRPYVPPTDPSWNPMEERLARTGWCTF